MPIPRYKTETVHPKYNVRGKVCCGYKKVDKRNRRRNNY